MSPPRKKAKISADTDLNLTLKEVNDKISKTDSWDAVNDLLSRHFQLPGMHTFQYTQCALNARYIQIWPLILDYQR